MSFYVRPCPITYFTRPAFEDGLPQFHVFSLVLASGYTMSYTAEEGCYMTGGIEANVQKEAEIAQGLFVPGWLHRRRVEQAINKNADACL